MIAMIVYVVLVLAGEVVAFGLGVLIDKLVTDAWSMIIYMCLFFGVIWGAWPVAVHITERWLMRSSEASSHARRVR